MNHRPSKTNFAVKSKARSLATMGSGFLDHVETSKMEERLELMKKTMEQEREERRNRGGQFWKSGQKGKLTTYANNVLQSRISNKKIGKVKMLTDEQLNIPNRNESIPLSQKLSNIANESIETFKPNPKISTRLCGQCETNEAALCCIQCTEVYCVACFSAYHKKGALKKHRSISLEVSSAPRLKSFTSDKRLIDGTSTISDLMKSQNDPIPASNSSGALKNEEGKTVRSSLINGTYNEAESAASFQEALMAWRTNKSSPSSKTMSEATPVENTVSMVAPSEFPSSLPQSNKNEGSYANSSTSTMKKTNNLADLMDKTKGHTLSYAEQLLVKKNRRTPISWESSQLDATISSNDIENPGQIKTCCSMEITPPPSPVSRALNTKEVTEKLKDDEPITFSSLYHLVTQESDTSVTHNEAVPFQSSKIELIPGMEDTGKPPGNFSNHSVSIVPFVTISPKKRPNSSEKQQTNETRTTKSASSNKSRQKMPINRVQTPKKQRPKSRTSSRLSRISNLTTSPTKELKKVSQLSKSHHCYNDENEPSLLMVGINPDGMEEVSLKEQCSSMVNGHNEEDIRPITPMKVSYTLYKMSPCSWHPEQSINQDSSDNNFTSNSNNLGQERHKQQRSYTLNEIQNMSELNCLQSKITPTSPAYGNVLVTATLKGDNQENKKLRTESANQSPDKETPSPRNSSYRNITRTPILACKNNNAITPKYTDKSDSESPNNLVEEIPGEQSPEFYNPAFSLFRSKTLSSIQNRSSPVCSLGKANKSKSLTSFSPIKANQDDLQQTSDSPGMRTPRKEKMSATENQQTSTGSPRHSPKIDTKSLASYEKDFKENPVSMITPKSPPASENLTEDQRIQKSESQIPTITSTIQNFRPIPRSPLTNKPKTSQASTIRNRSLSMITPTPPTKLSPRSKTMSIIQDVQRKNCEDVYIENSIKTISKIMSPASKIPETLLKRSDISTSSPVQSNKEPVLHSPLLKKDERSELTSPISDRIESFRGSSMNSLTISCSSNTEPLTVTNDVFPENISTATMMPEQSNKNESAIPIIVDQNEVKYDNLAPWECSSPRSSVATGIDIEENFDENFLSFEHEISISDGIDVKEYTSDSFWNSEKNTPVSRISSRNDIQENISQNLMNSANNTPVSINSSRTDNQERISENLTYSVKDTPVSRISSRNDIQENISQNLMNSANNTPVSINSSRTDNQEHISENLTHSVKDTPVSRISSRNDIQENISQNLMNSANNTPVSINSSRTDNQEHISENLTHSVKDTPVSRISSRNDIQENISQNLMNSANNTPVSINSSRTDNQEHISENLTHSVKDTLVSRISSRNDIQENISENLINSAKNTPFSRISSRNNIQESISENLMNSAKNTPISINSSGNDNQENISGNFINFAKNTPVSAISSTIDTDENIPVSMITPSNNTTKSLSSSTNEIHENLLVSSSSNIQLSPTLSKIDIPKNTVSSSRNTQTSQILPEIYLHNVSENIIPFSSGSDNNHEISDSLVPPPMTRTPTPPVMTIPEKQTDCSVTLAASVTDTVRAGANEEATSSSHETNSSGSSDKSINKNKTSQYNAMVYQMLINKHLTTYIPDNNTEHVPLLPIATEPQDNSITPDSSVHLLYVTGSTETYISSSDFPSITSKTTDKSSENMPSTSDSNGSITSALKGHYSLVNDKLATAVYMGNPDLYNTENSSEGSDVSPIKAKLIKGPVTTKKYIVRRQPINPDHNELLKSNLEKDGNSQTKSNSSNTSSLLEKKRTYFKYSNKDKNVISLENTNTETNLDLVLSHSEALNSSGDDDDMMREEKEEEESVFSSLTKMSVDSLEEGLNPNILSFKDQFLNSDDFKAGIDELEDQISEEIQVKALK